MKKLNSKKSLKKCLRSNFKQKLRTKNYLIQNRAVLFRLCFFNGRRAEDITIKFENLATFPRIFTYFSENIYLLFREYLAPFLRIYNFYSTV